MLGKFVVLGRPTNLSIVWQRPTVLAVGASGSCLDIYTLADHFSLLSPPSLGDGPI